MSDDGMAAVFVSLAADEPGPDAARWGLCMACEADDCAECETYGLSPEASCCCDGLVGEPVNTGDGEWSYRGPVRWWHAVEPHGEGS